MPRRLNLTVAGITIALYVGAIAIGLRVKDLSFSHESSSSTVQRNWQPPRFATIPDTPFGDSVRRGALLFDETPLYASSFTSSKITCSNCHADGGMQPFASPVVGLPALFPMYNQRAGHVISLKDRIQECFVRSENGKPLSYTGPEMQALVDYIHWLSEPQPHRRPFAGRGLIDLPDLKPDPAHGSQIYIAQCAGCHGQNGEGKPPLFPPLWGPDSFNDGAGMYGIHKMAAFVQHNMPQNRMGILSAQDAYDVSAFIHAQPRPAFNPTYKNF